VWYCTIPQNAKSFSLAGRSEKLVRSDLSHHIMPGKKKQKTEEGEAPRPARIAVIGAAWWSQGWHLPQLLRNPDAEIAAIMVIMCAKWQALANVCEMSFIVVTPPVAIPSLYRKPKLSLSLPLSRPFSL
jgi:hypothetical protein